MIDYLMSDVKFARITLLLRSLFSLFLNKIVIGFYKGSFLTKYSGLRIQYIAETSYIMHGLGGCPECNFVYLPYN